MIKTILTGSLLSAALLTLSGCAYKTACGVDECGNSYTDTTFRTYQEEAVQTCSNQCNTIAPAKTQCTPCKTPVVASRKPAIVAPPAPIAEVKSAPVLRINRRLKITVHGEGVAPTNTVSPAQAYALAKRAAVADSYRLIAERVKGVYVEGDDYIQNMMIKRSTVRTSVSAMVRNANVTETTFKNGLCEVEMEITLSYSDFAR